MKFNCIICSLEFEPSSAKPEHILLNALGGKKTARKVICSKCNETAGAKIDNELAGAVLAIRNLCNWKSGDGDSAPSLIGVETVDGNKINLLPGEFLTIGKSSSI